MMVHKNEAIEILNREINYEDKLVKDIDFFIMYSINEIKDISKEEFLEIKEKLNKISHDSMKHFVQFSGLIDFILKDGKDNY
jgi:hypothetical protein